MPTPLAPSASVDVGCVRRADHELAARRLELRDLAQHLVALLERRERPHRDALGARVAEHDALGDAGAHRVDHGVDGCRGHDRPSDRGALLPGLRRHLDDELLHVRVELGRARDRVGAEHARVDRVGLAREPHAAGLHGVVRPQALGGRRRPRERDEVAEPQVVEQVGDAARDQLQRALGQQARTRRGCARRPRRGSRWASPASRAWACRRGTRARTSRASPRRGS